MPVSVYDKQENITCFCVWCYIITWYQRLMSSLEIKCSSILLWYFNLTQTTRCAMICVKNSNSFDYLIWLILVYNESAQPLCPSMDIYVYINIYIYVGMYTSVVHLCSFVNISISCSPVFSMLDCDSLLVLGAYACISCVVGVNRSLNTVIPVCI